MEDSWNSIQSHPHKSLLQLFEEDDDRVSQFAFEQSGIYFDFSKTHIDNELTDRFAKLSEDARLKLKIDALFAGEVVNPSEGRAAEHSAERGTGRDSSIANASALRNRMRGLIEAIEQNAFGEISQIIHLGIGGSALGPELLLNALEIGDEKYQTSVISNIDGAALEPVLERYDAEKTLLVIASKSFSTAETFLNAQSVISWMQEQGVKDPFGRIVALTANPEKAVEWGVDESRVLPFAETIGGRYSIWSSINFSVALTLGFESFEDFLAGAQAMDQHFQTTQFDKNLPVLAAWIDQYYAQAKNCQTRAVFAYDERLRRLPDYLQQLEMESNGKSVTSAGVPLSLNSSPIVWGGVGTDAQHAVFQLLHQGTHLVPVEFLAVRESGHSLDSVHHEELLLNCFAQAASLMSGKQSDDPNRNYPGDRPSMTLLLDSLEAKTMGALLSFYEHRTYVNACLLGINPFDQFGVELGKEIAHALSDSDQENFDSSTQHLKKQAFGA